MISDREADPSDAPAPVVAVVGPGSADADLETLAEQIGAELGRHGVTLVCGGLGGVMAAASRGARKAGGHAVGILPGSDRHEANRHLSVAIPTGMGELRNALVVRAADAVIAVGGGYGTLSEIGFALRTGVPVIGLRTWELKVDGRADETITRADDPRAAVAAALAATR